MAAVFGADAEFGRTHCLKGYFACCRLQLGRTAGGRVSGRRCAPVHRERNAAQTGARRGIAALDQRRARSCGSRLGADPERASPRCAGIPPRALRQFLACAAGPEADVGSGRRAASECCTEWGLECRRESHASERGFPSIRDQFRSGCQAEPTSAGRRWKATSNGFPLSRRSATHGGVIRRAWLVTRARTPPSISRIFNILWRVTHPSINA